MSSTKTSRVGQKLLHANISTSISSAISGSSTSKGRTSVRGPKSSKRPMRHQMMQAAPPRTNQPAIKTLGPTSKAQHQKIQSGPAYPRDPASGLTGQRHSMEFQEPPLPDRSADPGGPASLHQVSTARQPPAPLQSRAGPDAQAALPRGPHHQAACSEPGAGQISLGGCGPKRPPNVPPRKHSPLVPLPRGPKVFLSHPRESGAAHAAGQAPAAGPPPAQPAPRRSSAGAPAAETWRQAATT
ncbi:hypothetical protein NDU88_001413 [Pleurodeles waltl]|uniref:Uncharacterized protein n=1 Tax=Pleurodeles waltl TaxID=8319 RepID=A0AAV7WMD6_PLEWA|nr:hypothetical protein NDU88_001413 [Pleurodeles waltl]